ncbi:DUF302 domain-containing protein [Pseudonocardia humida]|uniref:DUF302 domain-containing protein n=1 Tax=Pseudonocardia humida TaxID=2800819 RepID=A0ABT1ABB7_9PSEU|nr:DUF302 domain-containing protein [Pseudonocardia humida]MCO1660228.1 hypothetical protein [Pseudonocardia humida]
MRTVGAVLALSLSASACGALDGGSGATLRAALVPGQPAGSVTVAADGDPAALAQRLQDAITSGGGRVAAVVDHAAAAREAGVQIPPNTVVIGGPDAANTGMALFDPRAGGVLPSPFQVRQDDAGTTVLSFDSLDYLAALSGVSDVAVSQPLAEANAAILGAVAPGAVDATAAPLIGVTPVDYLLTVISDGTIAAAVADLQRAGARGGNNVLATLEFVPDTGRPRPGQPPGTPAPPRASTAVLITRPAVEAPLLAAAPTIGLDLPLRFVVFINERNETAVGYPDIRRIALRHGIPADSPDVVALAAEADKIARTGAGLEP